MTPAPESTDHTPDTPDPFDDGVRVVRRGPGANCSSIGSAVEMLFLSATVGAAVLAAVVAAIKPRAKAAPEVAPPDPSQPASRDDPSSEK